MRPTPIWAASPSGRTATEESGGAPACARQGSPTDGRPLFRAAHEGHVVPTRAATGCAPATVWPTPTQSWQLSGTARPTEPGRLRQCQPAATSEWLGGAASAGTDGPPCCPTGPATTEGAASVPRRHASTTGSGSPLSGRGRSICWRSGTTRPMNVRAGTQAESPAVPTSSSTGSGGQSAGLALNTGGKPHRSVAPSFSMAHHTTLAEQCVHATPWPRIAHRQLCCGIIMPIKA